MLALHPLLDIVLGIVVDDLNGVFLGVTLSLLHLWLDKKHKGKSHFVGKDVSLSIMHTNNFNSCAETYFATVTQQDLIS